jgi:hypothetical protein
VEEKVTPLACFHLSRGYEYTRSQLFGQEKCGQAVERKNEIFDKMPERGKKRGRVKVEYLLSRGSRRIT